MEKKKENININLILENPDNPRKITEEMFEKLVNSIKEDPDILDAKPLVVEKKGENYMVLGEYPRYMFCDNGKIASFHKGGFKYLKYGIDKNGYYKTSLQNKNKKMVSLRVARIIMEAFCGKSDLQVNHKDGNKKNNNINNLEYVSNADNQRHRRSMLEGRNVGVCFDKKSKKYRAYFQQNKKWEHLGFFDDEKQAKDVYVARLKKVILI